MIYPIQKLTIPTGCKVVKNEFTTYNPITDFTEKDNLLNLTEDLLQLEFEYSNLIIDLGWYGEISTSEGGFKIYVIEDKDWENPLRIEYSKSQVIINAKLEEILLEFIENGGKIKPVSSKV